MKFKRVIFLFCDIPILWISVVYVWSLGVDCGGLARPKGGASPVFLTCTQQDCTTDSKPAHNKQRAHNKTAQPAHNILKEHSQSTFEFTHNCTVCSTYEGCSHAHKLDSAVENI